MDTKGFGRLAGALVLKLGDAGEASKGFGEPFGRDGDNVLDAPARLLHQGRSTKFSHDYEDLSVRKLGPVVPANKSYMSRKTIKQMKKYLCQ